MCPLLLLLLPPPLLLLLLLPPPLLSIYCFSSEPGGPTMVKCSRGDVCFLEGQRNNLFRNKFDYRSWYSNFNDKKCVFRS